MSDFVNLMWGISDDRVVHITDVQNGIACRCLCPECGGALIARQGDIRAWHFAHVSGSECVTAPETALHKLAKQWLLDQKEFDLPAVSTSYRNKRFQVRPAEKIFVNHAFSEVPYGAVIPDVYLELHGNRQLFVEVAVTHFVDLWKQQKLADIRIPTLELDLSNVARDILPDVFDGVMREVLKVAIWVYHPDINRCLNVCREEERRKSELRRQKAREAAERKARNDETHAVKPDDTAQKRAALAAVYAKIEADRKARAELERQALVAKAEADRKAYMSKDAIGRLLHNARCLACVGYLSRLRVDDDPVKDQYACGECGRIWRVNIANTTFDLCDRRICPDCGSIMVRRRGSRGEFYGCSKFPACRRTAEIY